MTTRVVSAVLSTSLDDDRAARLRALDPTGSFIVQAPAGSGKTELLIQRLLTVLAVADHPSEVLAITFTNKAAGEMRERLLAALTSAAAPAEQDATTLELARRELALRVLQRDRELGWRLLDDFSMVLIDTFDAFCARITSRAPVAHVAQAAALAGVSESVAPLYREAARDALLADVDIADASHTLLSLAANRVDDVVELIANLLARRSQWLGEAVDTTDAAISRLTNQLKQDVKSELDSISAGLNPEYQRDIASLLDYTAQTLGIAGKDALAQERAQALNEWAEGGRDCTVLAWRAVAAMLLTGEGSELRKPTGVNKTSGFPKGDDKDFAEIGKQQRNDAKARMQSLLEQLAAESVFVGNLGKARHLPTDSAINDHVSTLKATLVVLRQAAGHLSLLLRERGVTDFSGVADAALHVLENAREDVMSGLDARLRHVLVDEVQDTNPAQFALLTVLVDDWSQGDGRTLFLVGDPMQSIYGFRDADVELFALAQTRGVAAVRLQPLRLSANYRSQPVIVEWVNQRLSRVFAQVAAWERSLVTFEVATATRSPVANARVQRIEHADADEEAVAIADQVLAIANDTPSATMAILVRTRAHADAAIAEFTRRRIPFVAHEFARWNARETIRDLLSLTYAIAQPSDRLALFSVLRSPWVGATLASLSALAIWLDSKGRAEPAWYSLAPNAEWQAALPADEQARLARAYMAFQAAEARAWMSPLSERIQAAWLQLDGPACCADDDAHDDASAFFAWLEVHATGGLLPARHVVVDLLDRQMRSFASGSVNSNAVEILTIHKAKGLEWDHVFLPGIDRKQRGDTRELAQWRFVSTAEDGAGNGAQQRSVLIAARDSRKRLEGSVFDYVRLHTSAARAAEVKRLLYVAATRARLTLTLSRCNAANSPATGSFSALLGDAANDSLVKPDTYQSKRLHLERSLTRWPSQSVEQTAAALAAVRRPAYLATVDDADVTIPQVQLNARAQGVVGHMLFEGLALNLQGFKPSEIAIERMLIAEGAETVFAKSTAARLTHWFASAATLDNVRFLFDANHSEASNELTLALNPHELLRVDRTFVTAEGERWLIDFKFSEPPASDLADDVVGSRRWLDNEVERYKPQLRQYANLLARLDASSPQSAGRRIRMALYFPWHDLLHEI